MNIYTAIGRLCADPETRQAGQTTVTEARMAFDAPMDREGKKTVFMRAKLWGRRGEAFAQYFTKGRPVFVSGSLESSNYTNRDGQRVEGIELNVTEWAFVPRDAGESAGESAPAPLTIAQHYSPAPRAGNRPATATPSNVPAFPESDPMDDIPF